MKKIIYVILFTIFSSPSYSAEYAHIPNKFFSYIKNGQTNQAIDYLYDTNKWVAKNSDQVINLKSQLSKIDDLVGNYVFYELISETKIGSRYRHLIYMGGYERQPLRYELKVYKAENDWDFRGYRLILLSQMILKNRQIKV